MPRMVPIDEMERYCRMYTVKLENEYLRGAI